MSFFKLFHGQMSDDDKKESKGIFKYLELCDE